MFRVTNDPSIDVPTFGTRIVAMFTIPGDLSRFAIVLGTRDDANQLFFTDVVDTLDVEGTVHITAQCNIEFRGLVQTQRKVFTGSSHFLNNSDEIRWFDADTEYTLFFRMSKAYL